MIILGAAGRDFHNFNTCFRGDDSIRVVAFTANQIPGISERRYPAELAGPGYPNGIPIESEVELEAIGRREHVDQVVFAYSDVTHPDVMHAASRALASGADFALLGPDRTMLRSRLPVIAVSAVRTGCGKSQIARWLAKRLVAQGWHPAALRHPMPYGDLLTQRVQRFGKREDLEAARCTVEEREEYEPYVEIGAVVFAGVDYARVLEHAEEEADIIIWDGGNNDFPFVKPDLHIVVVDALRPKQIDTHHPGETCLRMADIIVINKVDSASSVDIQGATDAARAVNPSAPIIRAASPVRLDEPAAIKGRRVLVVEDGPTITHGGMAYGAGYVAAIDAGAASFVDARSSSMREIAEVFVQYPHIGTVLPAMGYSDAQLEALRETILRSDAEIVVAGTPIDLGTLLELDRPVIRARYQFEELDQPGLGEAVDSFLATRR
jgi:predicted GTPase